LTLIDCFLLIDLPRSHFWLFPGAEADALSEIMNKKDGEEGLVKAEDTAAPAQEHSTTSSASLSTIIDNRGTKRASSIGDTSSEGIKVQRHM